MYIPPIFWNSLQIRVISSVISPILKSAFVSIIVVFYLCCLLFCIYNVVIGGLLNFFLKTSVVNMSNNEVIRLYLCSFVPDIALEKCI